MTTNVAPFTVVPRLTQIAMAFRPQGMIADMVCPRITVPGEKFYYTTFTTSESFTIPDTKVGRTGDPNEVEFGGTENTDATEDYGLDDPVPNKDIRNSSGTNFDPLGRATEGTALLVALARESRVADLLTTLTNYDSSLRTTLTGTDQWSDASSSPITKITAAADSMLLSPNTLVLGQAAWTALRKNAEIVHAVRGTGATKGLVTREEVATLFELDNIYVGQSFYNSAKKGQTASYARLWGKHASLLYLDRNIQSTQGSMPTFCITAQWGDMVAGTYNSTKGLEGSTVVRVGEHVKELITAQLCGYHFHNATA